MHARSRRQRRLAWTLLLSLGCGSAPASRRPPVARSSGEDPPTPRSSEPPTIVATYEPSPPEVVAAMLDLAEVTSRDRVLDLGSGDGRLVIAAARDYGAQATGVEFDAALVRRSREAIAAAGLTDRAQIVQGDLHEHPLAGTTVLTLFLWPSDNLRLRDSILHELPPGARVVSHDHDMEGWAPDRVLEVSSEDFMRRYGERSTLYLWIVPAAFEGCWTDPGGELCLELRQGFQVLNGTLLAPGRSLRLDAGRARGEVASLVARDVAGPVDLELRSSGDVLRLRVADLGIDSVTLRPCEVER